MRAVVDPYPTFNGIALDLVNDKVVMTDGNRKGVLWYARTAGGESARVTQPLGRVMGPDTNMGFIAGVAVDPARKEVYVVNNDVEDRMVVFDYEAQGNLKPKRILYVPHQSWGVALNHSTDEMAVAVQQLGAVMVYRREAKELEPALRVIRGPSTGMADTHGIFWDAQHREIGVTNHGNYAVITPYSAYDPDMHPEFAVGGHFREPSVEIFSDSASGDAKPLRVIQGSRTQLNWPMGADVDTVHDEIAVANNGDSAILVFRRTANGNVAPVRVIRGKLTGLDTPMSVAIDAKHDEIWAVNYGAHTALVFPRLAQGNVPPRRIVRNAPANAPTGGFGNPYAVAYDSKRDQILVPN